MANKRFMVKNGLDNNGQTLTNVATPATNTDAVNKAYADNKVSKVTTSTDNALVRFDGTTGDVQNSLVTVDDGGVLRIGGKTIFSKYFTFNQSGVSATYHELFRVAAWDASETSGRFTVAVRTGGNYIVSASYEWTSNHPGILSLTQTNASTYWRGSFKIAADCDYLGSVIFSVNFPTASDQSVVDVILSGESYMGGFTLSNLTALDAPPIGYTRVIDGRAFLPGYSTVGNAGAFLDKLLVGKSIDDGINKLQVEGSVSVSGNVGIGTSIPASILDIVGSTGDPTLTLRSSSPSYSGVLNIHAAGYGASNIFATGGSNALSFSTNSVSRMFIDSSGNVGVGTTAPTEKLHVVGNVLATGYKTTLAGVEKTGVTGTFTAGNKTMTVTNGLITLIEII